LIIGYSKSNHLGAQGTFKGALQLLMNRNRRIRFAQVPERVSTASFVVLIIGYSKSNHLGAQGTFKGALQLLMNRNRRIHFAQVPERVSTKSFDVLIVANSKSNHLGAQGTFTRAVVDCEIPRKENSPIFLVHPPALLLFFSG